MIYGNQDFAELLKEIIKDGRRHALYELTVEHADEMSVHILGTKPDDLLERNRPREDQEVKDYRLENYEPTTKAGADRAIKIIGKGFNPTLYPLVRAHAHKSNNNPGHNTRLLRTRIQPRWAQVSPCRHPGDLEALPPQSHLDRQAFSAKEHPY